MRILQVNTVCGYGSTGRIAVDLASFLEKHGNKCKIAYGRQKGNTSYSDTYYIGSKFDHNLHGVLSRITDKQGLFSKAATKNFISEIELFAPDVVHLHNIHGYYLNYKILFDFLSEKDIPVVWTFHDCWPFTGHCTYFDMVNCNKWKYGCKDCQQLKEYPTSLFFDNSKENYLLKSKVFNSVKNLTIVSPSHWLDNLVGESFLKNNKHIVINNGLNLDSFRYIESDFRVKHNLEGKTILLGVASIWGDRKGYNDFLKLSNIIDDTMVIVMVGLNDSQLSNLPKNIVGIKRTNSLEELVKIYSAADYFLNLTYQDNFPTTNIEALACGTPVITYNTGGSVECVTGSTGFILECGDYPSLLDVIPSFNFKREDCIARSKDFALESRYEDYLKLYEEVSCR